VKALKALESTIPELMDVNQTQLSAVMECGGLIPLSAGYVRDPEKELMAKLRKAGGVSRTITPQTLNLLHLRRPYEHSR
jgi:hypothetical protein